jgi:hypothetical protein
MPNDATSHFPLVVGEWRLSGSLGCNLDDRLGRKAAIGTRLKKQWREDTGLTVLITQGDGEGLPREWKRNLQTLQHRSLLRPRDRHVSNAR